MSLDTARVRLALAAVAGLTLTAPALAGRLKPVVGKRPVLVVGWDPHRPDHPAPAIGDVEKLVFGKTGSVQDYFRENSQGRFEMEKAGFFGWLDSKYPWQLYWRVSPYAPMDAKGTKHEYKDPQGKPRYLDDEGFYGGHSHKWAEAVRLVDPQFDYSKYDRDGDGVVQPRELTILMVIPQNGGFGTRRGVVGSHVPAKPLVVDGVEIPQITEAYLDGGDHLGLVAHELSHGILDTPDLYFQCGNASFAHPYAARSFSLMDQHFEHPHLDPAEKAWLGWVDPAVVDVSGKLVLHDVETTGQVYRLSRPGYGDREYFLLENRHPGTSYDARLPDRGLAIWHVIEDDGLSQNLPDRTGVDEKKLPCVWGQWARRAVRLIRPIRGSHDDRRSLWDGADPATGYDLRAVESAPDRVALRWADGTPSGYEITELSPAGPSMTFRLSVPARLRLRSAQSGKIVRAGVGRDSRLAAVSDHQKGWETFRVLPLGGNRIALMSDVSGKVVRAGIGADSRLAAVSTHVKGWETFEVLPRANGKVALRSAQSGKIVRAGVGPDSHLAAVSTHVKGWETFEWIGEAPAPTGLKMMDATLLPPSEKEAAPDGAPASGPKQADASSAAASPSSSSNGAPGAAPSDPPAIQVVTPIETVEETLADGGGARGSLRLEVRAGDRVTGTFRLTGKGKKKASKKGGGLKLIVRKPDGTKEKLSLGRSVDVDLVAARDGAFEFVVKGLKKKLRAQASLKVRRR